MACSPLLKKQQNEGKCSQGRFEGFNQTTRNGTQDH